MDKLVLKQRQTPPRSCEIVRLDYEAARTLNELCTRTGMPVRQLASQMIMFAAERVEIQED